MSSEQKLHDFIGMTFGSVWTLELLLLLASQPEYGWTETELVSALRASDLIIRRTTEELIAAGLIIADADGLVRFGPASVDLGILVGQVRDLYGRSPDKVRRTIIRSRSSGLTAFAEAFRIRKD